MDDDAWVVVHRSGDRKAAQDAGLVLTAVDIDNAVRFEDGVWQVLVPRQRAPIAEQELLSYRDENPPGVGRKLRPVPIVDSGIHGVLGYLVVIWGVLLLEQREAFGHVWRTAGRMQAGLVTEGEWWRTITAQTLHLDLGHIAANSVFGAFFGLFAGRALGSGWAWLSILLAGALGNGLNAFIQPAEHRAVGASTAVFAALGLIAAFSWRRGYYRGRIGWRRGLAPVIAGIALLAYTGTGDENTDIMAHLTGFAAGFGFGYWHGEIDSRKRFDLQSQWLAGGTALALVIFAWAIALGP